MTSYLNSWQRGSEWRRWDLHVHTPFSQLGSPFAGVSWSDYVTALEDAAKRHRIAVIGITDYMSIDGYEKLLSVQCGPERRQLESILLLPNIEFRCSPQTKEGNALNIHLLINVADEDHVAKIKKSLRNLRVGYNKQTYGCIRDELIEYARAQNPSLIDDAAAYKFGIQQFKPSYTEIFEWLDADGWLAANSVIGIANGKDGISGLPLDSFAGTRDELLRHAHFVFSGNPSDRQHYLGLKPGFPVAEIRRQYNSLKPCLHGSDAHSVDMLFEPEQKRYCWIKADPTFLGLQQAIKEPHARTFIGETPSKLIEVAGQKTYFIDRVDVIKSEGSKLSETWLEGCSVPLNTDLVAIIGNKGSGKSALADVIALLGHSRQKLHFSFLKKDRFRGKSGEPAKHFVGTLSWCDSSQDRRNLNDDPPSDKAELVRYIPQGHFENLCNEHVSGTSTSFERELRAVIFSHAGESIRLGALDFDQLIEQQESSYRDQLSEFRKDLKKLNQEIAGIESQLQPEVKRTLQELLTLKTRQIEEHNKIVPSVVSRPADELSNEQKEAANLLDAMSAKLKSLDENAAVHAATELSLAAKLKSIQNLRERMRLLERAYKQFQDDTGTDLVTLGLKLEDLVMFALKVNVLDEIASGIPSKQAELQAAATHILSEKTKLQTEQTPLNAKLNAPQLAYQQYLNAHAEWAVKLGELKGTPDSPETLMGLEARIAQLDSLPQQLERRRAQRNKLTGDIFDILDAQRRAREREQLFKPVQDLIQGNRLIRDDYKLQFQATLSGSTDSVAAPLFALIKQNSGSFRGEDESYATVRKIAEKYDFNKRDDVLSFVQELHNEIQFAAAGGDESAVGIANILRKDKATKDKTSGDVYDLLYSLAFLEPRYSLLFQETQIEQLSPGQRGALLLIFYLLVDKGRYPIILDQPEENLDNETVVSLLVPVLSEAKKNRQIIMVTHNPNLAVVCDAEQVIYSSFDRKNASKISYLAGAIENPAINLHVVNVLEGTKPAFDNRRLKYH
jgi:ABC-type lipoprotein export system ATPase subunit